MFIRVDRGAVPAGKVDGFVAFMRDDVVPDLRRLPGYLGTTIAVERKGGDVWVTTDWDSSRDREGCDEVLAAVLRNAPRLELVPIRIELFELAFVDSRPPG